jgi:DNA-binding CsgD family transcriptional regulator
MLAGADVEAARRAAGELQEVADRQGSDALEAMAAQAQGAVALAEGDARAALVALRRAWRAWQELEAPYEAARTRVLVGLACRGLGDRDGEEMELDGARRVFEQLGARPDLAGVEALTRVTAAKTVGGLTAREVEVLRLVAAGQTNRQIAAALGISGHTVRRHLQNVFARLDVPSRAAAAAFAVQHGLA